MTRAGVSSLLQSAACTSQHKQGQSSYLFIFISCLAQWHSILKILLIYLKRYNNKKKIIKKYNVGGKKLMWPGSASTAMSVTSLLRRPATLLNLVLCTTAADIFNELSQAG